MVVGCATASNKWKIQEKPTSWIYHDPSVAWDFKLVTGL